MDIAEVEEQQKALIEVSSGYRQAVTSGTSTLLVITIAYVRFVIFDEDSGPWSSWTLWRALQLRDNEPAVYKQTVSFFGLGLLFLLLSLVANLGAELFTTVIS